MARRDFQPYRVGFGVNATKTLPVRNYKNVENRVDLGFDPRPEDACQYFRIQEVTKGSVTDSGRISVDHSGGFGDTGLVRIPPASEGSLTGSSSEIPVPLQIRMPDEETFDRVKNENGTITCQLKATVTNGLVNDVVLKAKPMTNPFTGMFVTANQFLTAFVEALIDTFSATQQTCFGEDNTALLTNGTEQCPESAQQMKRMPTTAGWSVLIITMIGIAFTAAYRYR